MGKRRNGFCGDACRQRWSRTEKKVHLRAFIRLARTALDQLERELDLE
jgi:hypothetical protein